jgi:hypothetical protein
MTLRLHLLTDGAAVVKRTRAGLVRASSREVRRERERGARRKQQQEARPMTRRNDRRDAP